MKASGKTIIVIGAGSGMGRELTLQLNAKGAMVIALDIHQAPLQETIRLSSNPSTIKDYVVDVSRQEEVNAFVQNLLKEGPIDGVINNAGIIQPFVKVNDLGFTAIEKVMHVNFYGPLYLIKALLTHFLTRPEAHIVNTSSMGGFLPVPGQAVYGASKAAIKLLTEGLYAELVGTNVHVTAVYPGAIATNISQNSGVEIKSPSGDTTSSMSSLAADKAAAIIIDAMEKNKFRVLVGSDAKFMDFIYRLHPKYATEFIAKKMKALLA
jgi:short-subunit dehydrogenase